MLQVSEFSVVTGIAQMSQDTEANWQQLYTDALAQGKLVPDGIVIRSLVPDIGIRVLMTHGGTYATAIDLTSSVDRSMLLRVQELEAKVTEMEARNNVYWEDPS